MHKLDDINNNIIYVDTYQILGLYLTEDNRIEISKFVTKYQHLHNFIKWHELKHREYYLKSGYKSIFKQIWLDLKCYYILNTNKILHPELQEFRKLNRYTSKGILFEIIYLSILTFCQIPITFIILLKGIFRGRK